MSALVAFICSAILCIALAKVAPHMLLLDLPDERKQHDAAIPLVGGLAVLAGFAAGSMHGAMLDQTHDVTASLALMLLLGLADDARGIRASVKLVGQIVSVWFLVVSTHLVLTSIPVPFLAMQIPLGDFGPLLTVFIAVAILNAINMIDGLDGLAGGCLIVAAVNIAAASYVAGNPQITLLAATLCGSVLGFLIWNARFPWQQRARVFLGDAGALTIGLLVCWMAFELSLSRTPMRVPVTVVLSPLAVPLADLLAVSFWRIAEGRNPMEADRRHSHHLLLELGLSPRRVVTVIWVTAGLVAVLTFVAWRAGVSEGRLLGVMMFGALIHLVWFGRTWHRVRRARHSV